ncbi:MAG: hypothetical protein ACOH1L_05970 [Thermomonas sp.]
MSFAEAGTAIPRCIAVHFIHALSRVVNTGHGSVCHQLGQFLLDAMKSSVIVAYNTEHPTQDIDMTRKLHNTLMATIASSSLLVAGIMAGSRAAPEFDTASTASTASVLVSLDAQVEMVANSIEQKEAAPIKQARAVRHRRQSLAMPFYSFAPRS